MPTVGVRAIGMSVTIDGLDVVGDEHLVEGRYIAVAAVG
jgi:hypothetical protein